MKLKIPHSNTDPKSKYIVGHNDELTPKAKKYTVTFWKKNLLAFLLTDKLFHNVINGQCCQVYWKSLECVIDRYVASYCSLKLFLAKCSSWHSLPLVICQGRCENTVQNGVKISWWKFTFFPIVSDSNFQAILNRRLNLINIKSRRR